MKTKLLRKVRKRYEILFHPNGQKYYHKLHEILTQPTFEIIDNNRVVTKSVWNVYITDKYYKNEMTATNYEDGYKLALGKLTEIILKDYYDKGVRRNNLDKDKPIKVWHT